MAVIKQQPCINDTVLFLAESAEIGFVFVYTDSTYQWVARDDEWQEFVMLTKTERGYELVDGNGRSRGIVNIGEAYHNVDAHPACTSCAKDYVYQNSVECINAVCCDQELFLGNCAGEGWSVDWCELVERFILAPTITYTEGLWNVTDVRNPVLATEIKITKSADVNSLPSTHTVYSVTIGDEVVASDVTAQYNGSSFTLPLTIDKTRSDKPIVITAKSVNIETEEESEVTVYEGVTSIAPIILYPPQASVVGLGWSVVSNQIIYTFEPTATWEHQPEIPVHTVRFQVTGTKTPEWIQDINVADSTVQTAKITRTVPITQDDQTITVTVTTYGADQQAIATTTHTVPLRPTVPDAPTISHSRMFWQQLSRITLRSNVELAQGDSNGGLPITVLKARFRASGETNWTSTSGATDGAPTAFNVRGLYEGKTYTIEATYTNAVGESLPTTFEWTTPAGMSPASDYNDAVVLTQDIPVIASMGANQINPAVNKSVLPNLSVTSKVVERSPYDALETYFGRVVRHFVTGNIALDWSHRNKLFLVPFKMDNALVDYATLSRTNADSRAYTIDRATGNIIQQGNSSLAFLNGTQRHHFYFDVGETGTVTNPNQWRYNVDSTYITGHSEDKLQAMHILDFTGVTISFLNKP